MAPRKRKTIRFRGREEPVLETFLVRGRTYFALEQLSRRGAFRVFDPIAGAGGDYRVLYRFPASQISHQRLEILRRISGPNANRNFPPIVESVRHGHDFFVVVSWVHGTNLRDYFQAIRDGKTPRPSVTESVRLIRGLAHGLGHFHRRTNIVHGDISPANIILTSGTKQLVLVDFGSAWPVEAAAMKEDGDGVTQPYAAPERLAEHAAVDLRADLFSLSVVAYELLTLEIPFDGLGGQAGLPKWVAQTAASYRPPSERIHQADRLPTGALARLDRCVGKGLALLPDGRFATRAEYLSAWDELRDALKLGDRLTPWEMLLVRGFESVERLFRRKKT